MRKILVALLGTVLIGCADIERLSVGSCGNGVVDSDTEDCDYSVQQGLGAGLRCGRPEEANACRFSCAEAKCPSGWTCAPDGACVHAGGQWTGELTTSTSLDDWSLGELDDDGLVDLVGVRGGELEVRFGDGAGRFGEPRVRYMDRSGDATFRDADGDGLLEVAVPTPAGVLVFQGDPARELAPRPLAYAPHSLDLDPGPRVLWGIPLELPPAFGTADDDGCQGVLSLHSSADFVGVRGILFPFPREAVGAGTLPFVASKSACADSDPACIGRGAIHLPRPQGSLASAGATVLVAFPEHDHALLVTPVVDPFSSSTEASIQKWSLGAPHVVSDFSAPIAFTTASGQSEVYVPSCLAGMPRLLRGIRGADGKLELFAVDERFELGGSCSAPGAVLLAAGDLDGDGLADFVLSTGALMGTPAGQPVPAQLPLEASWREAVLGDFDGNQHLDIAALRADGKRVDVLYSDGCKPTCGFALFPIELSAEARHLKAANFDGIGGTDLAFVVSAGAKARVQVAFATGGALATPETVAVLPGVQRMEAARFADLARHCDTTADLLISRVHDNVAGYSVLLGSAHGAMYAPLTLGMQAVLDQPIAVTLARSGKPWLFAQTEGKVHTAIDVLAEGAIGTASSIFASSAVCPTTTGVPESAFLWTAADVDHDGVDEVIGVERLCADASLSSSTSVVTVRPEAQPEQVELPVPLRTLNELLLHDLDGDSELDLALAHAGGLAIHWGASGGWSKHLLDRSMPDARSLALVDADAKPGKELAVLSAEGLVVLAFAGRNASELPWSDPTPGKKVRAADVNGDSVDDLLVSEDDRVRVLLGTPHRKVVR